MEIADRGLDAALAQNAALARGVNVRDGEVVHQALREA
jgi:alanine dehydrogenase